MNTAQGEIMRGNGWPILVAGLLLGCLLLVVRGNAQDFPDPDEPPGEKPKPEGSLKPRPETDDEAEAWVAKLGAPKAVPLSVNKGTVLYHTLSPDGSRLYFYRNLKPRPVVQPDEVPDVPPDEPDDIDEDFDGDEEPSPFVDPRDLSLPEPGQYVLCVAAPGVAEARVIETGVNCLPPLFLPDGRLVVTVRKHDTDGDGTVTEMDEQSLVVCNADGGSPWEAATLSATESPLAVWKGGKEVLLSDFNRHDVNGWIMTLPLTRGAKKRSPVVKGFNVALVLPDDKLVIERKQAKPIEQRPANPWGWGWGWRRVPDDPDEVVTGAEAVASLLDVCEFIIFNPADGSEQELYSPSQRAYLGIHAENSFFGHQEHARAGDSEVFDRRRRSATGPRGFELLIVDGKENRDTRARQTRFDYLALGWLEGRGLLAVEHGRLTKQVLLMDRALKFHVLASFEFDARGFVCSKDGSTIVFLQVEDTDLNGILETWVDDSQPFMIKLK